MPVLQKMDHEFDKEIDTLLRKAHRAGPVLVGDFTTSRHLDADEISAFAENAMPEKTRALYMGHMADCDRCRKILANLLSMNEVVVPGAAPLPAITIAERAPWYRRLFLFPNLAYVMGSLVLIFGGFLAFTLVRQSNLGPAAISKLGDEEQRAASGPNIQTYPDSFAANSNASEASNSVTANASSNSATSRGSADTGVSGPADGEREFALDGVSATEAQPVATPAAGLTAGAAAPPPPVTKDARDDDSKVKTEDKPAGVTLQELAKNDAQAKQQAPYASTPAQSGPMRNNESNYQRQLENMDRRAIKKEKARDEESSGRRVVGGRTFEKKQGVWYDVGYQGRPTINVRRGSAEFERLDGGLRSIANSIVGTVVVVWGAKAYRIQ